MHQIEQLTNPSDHDFLQLGELLADAVAGGASVHFIEVPSAIVAQHWWRSALVDQHNRLLVARDELGRIVGCVRLLPAQQPNGHHRAEIGKLLVLREHRGQGIASALMCAVEAQARDLGKSLLLLDTETGSAAEHFYRKRGWTEVGYLSDHTYDQQGELSATTFFAKRLSSPAVPE